MGAIYARRIIEDHKITDPREINLERIADSLEVEIQEADLDGCDGILQMVAEPKCGIITVKRSIKELGQKRFVIAHELGHYEIPDQSSQNYECGAIEFGLRNHQIRPDEMAANEFAAELLMPESLFKPKLRSIKPGMNLIKSLALEFQTTLTATLRRFVSLTDDRCAMVYSVDGKAEYFKPSSNFQHNISLGTPLHSNSRAIDFFETGRIEDKKHSVLAYAWITSNRISRNACIYEHSIAQPSYNSVLTLLWISQDIDGFSSSDDSNDQEEDLDHFTPDGNRWRW